MSPALHAARLGVSRGLIEFRQTLLSPDTLGFNLFFAVGFLAVLFFQRRSTVAGASLPLATLTLPSVLGMMVAFGGCLGAAGALAVEREDGTLLRAKAIPHGMVGYLVGRIVSVSLGTVLTPLVVLAAGLFLVPEVASADLAGWLTLAWVVVLGLLATLPWGALVGSLAKTPNAAAGLCMLTIAAVASISGIFYPISALPGWLQGVAQGFPIYWLGLGLRSALLPDAAAVVEIAGSWRHLETVAVLCAWAAAGFLAAPPVLRRMARRESGANMAERRQRALQRVG
jgi:ABC-2 type transport system permease protein